MRVGAAGDAAVGAASDATYGFVAEPAAISAHPGSGARSGGEPITVYGSNFVDASELSCRFGGSALSDARWVSATELVCASPAGAGTVSVEVTVNGRDWGASSASFAYLAENVTYAVTPASSPAAGGAELAVSASSPAAFDGADARCRFGVVDVAATRGGDGTLACVAPALDAGAYALTVVVEDAPRAFLTYEAFDVLAATFAPLLGPTTGGTAVAVDRATAAAAFFKIEFHIMHGGWLAAAAFFRNTATVQIVTPRRAKFVNEYSQNLLREEERSRNRESKKTDLITGKVPVRAARNGRIPRSPRSRPRPRRPGARAAPR